MTFDELLIKYLQTERENHQRKIGRYWSSDIVKIIKGELTPENFFEKQKIDLTNAYLIATGIAFEELLHKIFQATQVDYQYQAKQEYPINEEIVLVVKADFVFKNFILETKYHINEPSGILKKDTWQLECQARVFGLPVLVGYFGEKFKMKTFHFYPYALRWKKIKMVLFDFHERLKKLYPQLLFKPKEEVKEEKPQLKLNITPEIILETNEIEKKVNEIIKEFRCVSPTYDWMFKIKTQREAGKRLLNKIGEEKLIKIIHWLPKVNKYKFAPKVSTLYQLEKKLPEVLSYIQIIQKEEQEKKAAEEYFKELEKKTKALLRKI